MRFCLGPHLRLKLLLGALPSRHIIGALLGIGLLFWAMSDEPLAPGQFPGVLINVVLVGAAVGAPTGWLLGFAVERISRG